MKLKNLFEEELTKGQVVEWLRKHCNGHVLKNEIDPSLGNTSAHDITEDMIDIKDNIVSIDGGIELVSITDDIPFKLGTIDGSFTIYDSTVSLKNLPTRILGEFNFTKIKIKSLDHFKHFPEFVDGDVNLHNCELTSLEGLHKNLKHMNGVLWVDINPIKSHLLSPILIPGCTRVRVGRDANERLTLAATYVNDHLGEGKSGVLDAQNELIDAGLDEFAEL